MEFWLTLLLIFLGLGLVVVIMGYILFRILPTAIKLWVRGALLVLGVMLVLFGWGTIFLAVFGVTIILFSLTGEKGLKVIGSFIGRVWK